MFVWDLNRSLKYHFKSIKYASIQIENLMRLNYANGSILQYTIDNMQLQ